MSLWREVPTESREALGMLCLSVGDNTECKGMGGYLFIYLTLVLFLALCACFLFSFCHLLFVQMLANYKLIVYTMDRINQCDLDHFLSSCM